MPKRKLDKDYTYRGVFYVAGPSVEVPEGFKAGSPALGGQPTATDLESIDSIRPEVAYQLRENGYGTLEDLKIASDEELLMVSDIGKSALKKIRSQL